MFKRLIPSCLLFYRIIYESLKNSVEKMTNKSADKKSFSVML